MAFNVNAQVVLSAPKNLTKIRTTIQKGLANTTVAVKVVVDKNDARRLGAFNKEILKLNASMKTLNTNATRAAQSIGKLSAASAKLNTTNSSIARSTGKVNKSLDKTKSVVKETGNEIEAFGKDAALAIRRFSAFTIATGAIFGFVRAVQTATSEALKFEREMVKIVQVSGATKAGIKSLNADIDSLSTTLGVNANELVDVARILTQTGRSVSEVRAALKGIARSSLSPTFGTMKATTEGVVAALEQFDISAKRTEQVLGSLNAVSKKFAVESEDLITVIRRTGGVFAAASGDIKKPEAALAELIGIFTAVRSTTRETADTIATGLRTIFSRLQRKTTIEFLKQFNIDLLDSEGKFVGFFESFRRLSDGLSELQRKGDTIKLGAIVEELGGIRQVGKLIPAIKNFSKAEAARAVALKGTGSITKDVATATQNLSVQIDQLQQRFGKLIRDIAQSDTFQNLSRFAISAANSFITLADALRPALPLITAFAGIKIAGAAFSFTSGFLGGIKKGGGSGGVGSNLGGALSGGGGGGAAAVGSSVKQNAQATSKNILALNNNTTQLTNLNQRVNLLVSAMNKVAATVATTSSVISGLSSQLGATITALRQIPNVVSRAGRGGLGRRKRFGGEIPKFANGGKVKGPSHAQGGVIAELEGGETVIPKRQKAMAGRLIGATRAAQGQAKGLTLDEAIAAGRFSPSVLSSAFGAKAVADKKALLASGAVKKKKPSNRLPSSAVATLKPSIVGGLFLQKGAGGTKGISKAVPKGQEGHMPPEMSHIRGIKGQIYTGLLRNKATPKVQGVIRPILKDSILKASRSVIETLELPSFDINENRAAELASKKVDISSIEGFVFEALVSGMTNVPLAAEGASFDFPNVTKVGRERMKDLFRPTPIGRIMDAKRTLSSESVQSGTSSIAKKTLNSLINKGGLNPADFSFSPPRKRKGKRLGGRLGFNDGGRVPVAISNGEIVVSDPKEVSGNIEKLRAANSGAGGGDILGLKSASVVDEPGKGGPTADNVRTSLPAGSFVINAKDSSNLMEGKKAGGTVGRKGLAKGGIAGAMGAGGMGGIVQTISTAGIALGVISTLDFSSFEGMINGIAAAALPLAFLTSNSNKASDANEDLAKSADKASNALEGLVGPTRRKSRATFTNQTEERIGRQRGNLKTRYKGNFEEAEKIKKEVALIRSKYQRSGGTFKSHVAPREIAKRKARFAEIKEEQGEIRGAYRKLDFDPELLDRRSAARSGRDTQRRYRRGESIPARAARARGRTGFGASAPFSGTGKIFGKGGGLGKLLGKAASPKLGIGAMVAGLAVGPIADAIGQALGKQKAGDAQGFKGEGAKNKAGIIGAASGAASGALTGFGMGAMTGPAAFILAPLLGIIGGVTGGLAGLAGALKEQIRFEEFDKLNTSAFHLSTALEDLSNDIGDNDKFKKFADAQAKLTGQIDDSVSELQKNESATEVLAKGTLDTNNPIVQTISYFEMLGRSGLLVTKALSYFENSVTSLIIPSNLLLRGFLGLSDFFTGDSAEKRKGRIDQAVRLDKTGAGGRALVSAFSGLDQGELDKAASVGFKRSESLVKNLSDETLKAFNELGQGSDSLIDLASNLEGAIGGATEESKRLAEALKAQSAAALNAGTKKITEGLENSKSKSIFGAGLNAFRDEFKESGNLGEAESAAVEPIITELKKLGFDTSVDDPSLEGIARLDKIFENIEKRKKGKELETKVGLDKVGRAKFSTNMKGLFKGLSSAATEGVGETLALARAIKEAKDSFKAITTAMKEFDGAIAGAVGDFSVNLSNIDKEVKGILSGNQTISADAKINPFENIQGRKTAEFEAGFSRIRKATGAELEGGAGIVEFTRDISSILKATADEFSGADAKTGNLEIEDKFKEQSKGKFEALPPEVQKQFTKLLRSKLDANRSDDEAIGIEVLRNILVEGGDEFKGIMAPYIEAASNVTKSLNQLDKMILETANIQLEISRKRRQTEMGIVEKRQSAENRLNSFLNKNVNNRKTASKNLAGKITAAGGLPAGVDPLSGDDLLSRREGLEKKLKEDKAAALKDPTDDALTKKLGETADALEGVKKSIDILSEDMSSLEAVEKDLTKIQESRLNQRQRAQLFASRLGSAKNPLEKAKVVADAVKPVLAAIKASKGIPVTFEESASIMGNTSQIQDVLGWDDTEIERVKAATTGGISKGVSGVLESAGVSKGAADFVTGGGVSGGGRKTKGLFGWGATEKGTSEEEKSLAKDYMTIVKEREELIRKDAKHTLDKVVEAYDKTTPAIDSTVAALKRATEAHDKLVASLDSSDGGGGGAGVGGAGGAGGVGGAGGATPPSVSASDFGPDDGSRDALAATRVGLASSDLTALPSWKEFTATAAAANAKREAEDAASGYGGFSKPPPVPLSDGTIPEYDKYVKEKRQHREDYYANLRPGKPDAAPAVAETAARRPGGAGGATPTTLLDLGQAWISLIGELDSRATMGDLPNTQAIIDRAVTDKNIKSSKEDSARTVKLQKIAGAADSNAEETRGKILGATERLGVRLEGKRCELELHILITSPFGKTDKTIKATSGKAALSIDGHDGQLGQLGPNRSLGGNIAAGAGAGVKGGPVDPPDVIDEGAAKVTEGVQALVGAANAAAAAKAAAPPGSGGKSPPPAAAPPGSGGKSPPPADAPPGSGGKSPPPADAPPGSGGAGAGGAAAAVAPPVPIDSSNPADAHAVLTAGFGPKAIGALPEKAYEDKAGKSPYERERERKEKVYKSKKKGRADTEAARKRKNRAKFFSDGDAGEGRRTRAIREERIRRNAIEKSEKKAAKEAGGVEHARAGELMAGEAGAGAVWGETEFRRVAGAAEIDKHKREKAATAREAAFLEAEGQMGAPSFEPAPPPPPKWEPNVIKPINISAPVHEALEPIRERRQQDSGRIRRTSKMPADPWPRRAREEQHPYGGGGFFNVRSEKGVGEKKPSGRDPFAGYNNGEKKSYGPDKFAAGGPNQNMVNSFKLASEALVTGFSPIVQSLNAAVDKLQNLPALQLQMETTVKSVEVILNGASIIANFQDEIRGEIKTSIAKAIYEQWDQV